MNRAPLITAGVAVLCVGAYMVYQQSQCNAGNIGACVDKSDATEFSVPTVPTVQGANIQDTYEACTAKGEKSPQDCLEYAREKALIDKEVYGNK